MPLDQFATQKETKACSRDLGGASILRLHKPPKDAGLLVGGNAYALIADREPRDVRLDLFMHA